MIKNEYQLMVTKSWIEKFHQAIMNLYQNEEKRRKDPDGWQLLIDSYYAHIKNLHTEIAEYKNLKNHNPENSLVLQNVNLNVDEIGEILIKVRLAKKITEKELAALTQLTEEHIKEYEKHDYQNASFDTVIEVADALGVKLQHCIVVAEINEFLESQLMEVRETEKIEAEFQSAIGLMDCN
ncbi:helix-turn-helix domain-containing protein [Scytonema sp. NUACC26]|uniref:helix-turn-helix domain-containing protein n=1 Tax=Scytonema sp. NUACC26 TaxID=3140176 RepID=UPI0034DBE738